MRSKLVGMGLLALMLTGCAHHGPQVPEILLPPQDLMQECSFRERVLVTNADLARAYLEARGALELCNNEKAALREWAERAAGGRTQK